MTESHIQIQTIVAKENKNGIEEAECPFCMQDNTKEHCKHFFRKWSSAYKSLSTGRKIEPDRYLFRHII